jgi:hypothetical protein
LFLAAALAPDFGRAVCGVLARLGYINLILLAFNMLPALPLDGGRVLRALLWRARGDFSSATRTAAAWGEASANLLISLGVLLFIGQGVWSGVWLAFVGWFLLEAATAEARDGLLRSALGALRVGDLTVREPVTVAANTTLEHLMETTVRAHRFTTYPVVDDSPVVGLLRLAASQAFPAPTGHRRPPLSACSPSTGCRACSRTSCSSTRSVRSAPAPPSVRSWHATETSSGCSRSPTSADSSRRPERGESAEWMLGVQPPLEVTANAQALASGH